MKTANNLQIQSKFLSKKRISQLALYLQIVLINIYFMKSKAQGQTIVTATDGTATTVIHATPTGTSALHSRFDIQGGDYASNNQKLSNSLTQLA
mgnify:CR=1 FL=1